MDPGFGERLATTVDLPALHAVMQASIAALQAGFLSAEQVTASSRIMGLDSQLVADDSYFIVERAGRIAGCGGWSRRATLYGGDHSADLREPRLLDPATEAARVRAMYTHPDFARQSVGRRILALCEAAARDAGFARAELMATLAGEPLYRACGYTVVERSAADIDGIAVPLVRMTKPLAA